MMHRDALTALASGLLVAACGPKETTPPAAPPVTAAAEEVEAPPPETPCNYIVLIDAGSDHSRAYTFQIETHGEGTTPDLKQLSYAAVEPGLASFKDSPDGAAGSLTSLLTSTGSVLEALPDECEGKTPTALMASGAMRLLEGQPGGDAAAKSIYDAVGQAVRDTGLDLRFAGTISGQQEALYTWTAANYALGHLSGDASTVGTLDLDTATASIAFVPEESAAATTTLKFGSTSFAVYAHAYTGYGVDQALEYLADPTCFPKGLTKEFAAGPMKGKGRYDQCIKKLAPVVTPKTCAGTCGLAQPGSDAKEGIPQPPLPATMSFMAIGGFASANTELAPSSPTIGALRQAAGGPKGKTGLCGTKWDKAEGATAEQENACFTAGWITSLLGGYGFTDSSEQITWTTTFGEVDSGWALGAALCSVTSCLAG